MFPSLLAEPWFLAYPPTTAKATAYGLPYEYRTMIDSCNGFLAQIGGGHFLTISENHRLFLRG